MRDGNPTVRARWLYGVSAAAALLLAVGCGGGGSGSSAHNMTAQAQSQEDSVVVGYDATGNGSLDYVTLDLSSVPVRIVALLEGDGQGSYVDRSDTYAGRAVDDKIAQALQDYQTNSDEIAIETTLQLTDANGDPLTVVVYP
ncbi:MAG: hypothetical protein D6776_01785 [Planctomycetota bacterium]|nr:MAG: hypothetical protein D6776_01785 [Planctomycetota bacterium]